MRSFEPLIVELDRIGTNSVKWDQEGMGNSDTFASSIADLDFATAHPVVDALHQRIAHGAFGYTFASDDDYQAIVDWYSSLHRVDISRSDIILLPFGPRAALQFISRSIICENDVILVPTPSYPGLLKLGGGCGATIVEWPIVVDAGRYRLDLHWLRMHSEILKPNVLAFCNPNNPLGVILEQSDLTSAIEILTRDDNKLRLILSDEVHGDLAYGSTLYQGVCSAEFSYDTMALSSVGKTFNLSGLSSSYLITRSHELKCSIRRCLNAEGFYEGGLMGCVAQTAAFSQGRIWRDELVSHLEEVARNITRMLISSETGLSALRPEASFLLWIDHRNTGLNALEMEAVLKTARLRVQPGDRFGSGGEGHIRYNFGCSAERAYSGIQSLIHAVREFNRS